MGWKGTLRSVNAAVRRAEREARRRQRELERQQQQWERMQEIERAHLEVERFENYVALLLTVHQECSEPWDWHRIQSAPPPTKPIKSRRREEMARHKRDNYEETFLDMLLNRINAQRKKLDEAVKQAQEEDEQDYQVRLASYQREYQDWSAMKELASCILAGDSEAYQDAYLQTRPFSDMQELGLTARFFVVTPKLIQVDVSVRGNEVVPSTEKRLLKSGKLSERQVPRTKYLELYQDYVCSCVLRVAGEFFALLPINMVIVNACTELLNTTTGYIEEQPILSVAVPRKTFENLSMHLVDPSDALQNFVHNMKFRKTQGFESVEPLDPAAFPVLLN